MALRFWNTSGGTTGALSARARTETLDRAIILGFRSALPVSLTDLANQNLEPKNFDILASIHRFLSVGVETVGFEPTGPLARPRRL